MKRIFLMLLFIASLLCTVLAAFSCGESAPEKAIVGYFEALHNLDSARLKKYCLDGNIGTVDFSALNDRADLAKKMLQVGVTVQSDGIDLSSATDAGETTARVSLAFIDYSALFGSISGEMAISGGEKAQLLSNALENGDYSIKKAEIEIVLIKQDGEWKIPSNAQKNSRLLNTLNVTYIIKWITE